MSGKESSMHKGFFITFEGIDGVGKSTQLNMLTLALSAHGDLINHGASTPIYFTKEPGDGRFGSAVGPGIREIIFKKPGTRLLAPGVADLLFLADHVQNVHDVRKALERGQIVISDRYADSQFAYAAHPSKRAPAWACRFFAEQYGVVPDLTVLLFARGDAVYVPGQADPVEDVGWALERANARRGAEAGKQDGKAWNDVEAQRAIQNAYFMALRDQHRTRIIDVKKTSTPEEIHARILDEVTLALTSHNSCKPFNLPLVETFVEAA